MEADGGDTLSRAMPSGLRSTSVDHIAHPFCRSSTSSSEVALDAQTALGFSARDLLDAVAVARDAEIHWGGDDIAVGPETGEHRLHVELAPRGEHARLVDPDAEVIGGGLVCRSWLEIGVTVSVQSDSGALNERFDATVYAQRAQTAYLQVTAVDSELAGELVALPEDASTSERTITIALTFTATGVSGLIASGAPAHDEIMATPIIYKVAYIGPIECAYASYSVALDESVIGITPRWMLDRVAPRVGIEWDDGATTDATLIFDAEPGACLLDTTNVANPSRGLVIPGMLRIESDDGRLAGSYSTSLGTITRTDGEVVGVGVGIQSAGPRPSNIVTPAELGFPLQSREGFDDLTMQFSLELDEDGSATGDIQLIGRNDTSCVQTDDGEFCESTPTTLEHGTLR